MDYPSKEILEYGELHTTEPGMVLEELERETYLKMLMPNMVSGHVQGRILAAISGMIRPRKVLEIGTFTGYSAICLAEGLTEGGSVITIDINEELEDMVRKYIEKARLSQVVDLRIGNALEIIPGLTDDFDLVFIDADKENYINYYNLVIEKLRPGGYILADNVLWSAKVLDTKTHTDTETTALAAFNKMVHEDPRVENVLLPVRDGLMLIKKKA